MIPGLALLDRWLLRRYAAAFLTFAGVGGLLFLVVDVFINLRKLLERPSLIEALWLRYGPTLPELFLTLSPFLTLLSGLWVVVTLQRNNELVPLVAAGFGPRRLSLPLLLGAALVAGLVFADRELLLPRLAPLRRLAGDLGEAQVLPPRPVPDGAEGVLAGAWYRPSDRALLDVRYTRLDERGGEALSIFAAEARHEADAAAWRLTGGVAIRRREGRDTLEPIGPGGLLLPSRLVPEDVEASIDSPSYLSAAQLRAQLARTPGFKHLEVQLYERFTYPAAGLVLMLVSLPLAFGARGGVSGLLRYLSCIGVSLGYFVLAAICYEMGTSEVLPAAPAAFAPLALFGLVGAALFARGTVREG